MIITPISNRCQTGNTLPPMSKRILDAAVQAKIIAQRLTNHPAAKDDLIKLGNDLIKLSQRTQKQEGKNYER